MQPQINTWRNRDYQHISHMIKKSTKKPTCKRCKKNFTDDIICQECKNELLSHFEASSDWQMAYEMEQATLVASKFRSEEEDEIDMY